MVGAMSYSSTGWRGDQSYQFQWDGRIPVEHGGLENKLSTPPTAETKPIRTVLDHCSVTPVLGLESASWFFGCCCSFFSNGKIWGIYRNRRATWLTVLCSSSGNKGCLAFKRAMRARLSKHYGVNAAALAQRVGAPCAKWCTKTAPHGQVQTVYWHPNVSTAAGMLLTYLCPLYFQLGQKALHLRTAQGSELHSKINPTCNLEYFLTFTEILTKCLQRGRQEGSVIQTDGCTTERFWDIWNGTEQLYCLSLNQWHINISQYSCFHMAQLLCKSHR